MCVIKMRGSNGAALQQPRTPRCPFGEARVGLRLPLHHRSLSVELPSRSYSCCIYTNRVFLRDSNCLPARLRPKLCAPLLWAPELRWWVWTTGPGPAHHPR